MSKERLEEIKKHRDEAENSIDEYEFEKINFYNLHVDWLIEQAERVQELEEDLTKYRNGFEFQLLINNSIKKQNKHYRETIEEAIEYANSPKILTSPAGIEKILSKALEGEE